MSLLDTCPISDLSRGFTERQRAYCCVFCDAQFSLDVIHRDGDVFRLPDKAAEHHVVQAHGSIADAILALGKSAHGLSDTQRTVLALLAAGKSDADIAEALGGRSLSTVRNHRFQIRKQYREARLLVALMESLDDPTPAGQQFVDFHATLPTTDARTAITHDEDAQLADKYFRSDSPLCLDRIPKREKHKLVVLRKVVSVLVYGKRYSEKELNLVLKPIFADYVTIRRYLVDYRFLDRLPDGSAYWRIDHE